MPSPSNEPRLYCAIAQPVEGGVPVTAISTVHKDDYDALLAENERLVTQRDDALSTGDVWAQRAAQRLVQIEDMRAVLDDVADWMDHIEGEGRLRRTEVREQVAAAYRPLGYEEEGERFPAMRCVDCDQPLDMGSAVYARGEGEDREFQCPSCHRRAVGP